MERFYLGTHQPHWLWGCEADFPLFVSRRRLARYKTVRPAATNWALDSGGFTELSTYGQWRTTPEQYVREVAAWDRRIGRLDWAAPQDWMCEPFVVSKTGLSVAEHQARTVANFATLSELWPRFSDRRCPFVPVLQGWSLADYERCAELYAAAGVRLSGYPVAGIGSVCRRQSTDEIGSIVAALSPQVALHGFGVKTLGLLRYGQYLTSADSMAWSFDARRAAPLPGHRHKNCANCLPYARRWRQRLVDRIPGFSAA